MRVRVQFDLTRRHRPPEEPPIALADARADPEAVVVKRVHASAGAVGAATAANQACCGPVGRHQLSPPRGQRRRATGPSVLQGPQGRGLVSQARRVGTTLDGLGAHRPQSLQCLVRMSCCASQCLRAGALKRCARVRSKASQGLEPRPQSGLRNWRFAAAAFL